MRLLVVGASGFLGRNLVQLAARTDWETLGTFHDSRTFPKWARLHGCDPIRRNLLSRPGTWSADVCVYLAGNASHLESVKSPVRDLRLNVEALVRFLQTFRGGLVYMSSAAVYEGHRGRVGPRTCLHPTMPYAVSKRSCEAYIAHHLRTGHLKWATILRLYYAYGLYDRQERLVPRLVAAAKSGASHFTVTSPRGTLIDPLYAEDVARAALSAATGRCPNRTLDLCSGHPGPVSALVRQAIASQAWGLRVLETPRPNETPLRFHSSADPARKDLGLSPYVPLEKGIGEYVRWVNHPGSGE